MTCPRPLLGTSPSLPASTIRILRRDVYTHAVAIIARERQIELMPARLTPRLVPLTDRVGPKQVRLPPFDTARWADADCLTRRAVLLAQYCLSLSRQVLIRVLRTDPETDMTSTTRC